MNDTSEIVGEALMAKLSKMAESEINENGMPAHDVVRALLTVAGNIGGATHGSHVR